MMRNIQSVSVMYHGRKVGTLSMGSRSVCQFEYDKDWLADGFSISPLKLPLKAGLFTADYMPFNGNFGIFEDSLPGGYGEYLLRKILNKSGIDSKSLTLAPAYDLTNDNTLGEHASTINYKGIPTDVDLIAVGTNIRMTRQRCRQIMDEVKNIIRTKRI